MREVDEAVRQDEVAGFAKKYGWPLGIGIAIGLAAFGGFLIWQDRSRQGDEAESETLVQAIDELQAGNTDITDEKLTELSQGESGAAYLAAMMRAAIAVQDDRLADGVALYEGVANNDDAPQLLRDLATLRLVAAEYEQLSPQQVIDRIGAMATPGHAFFGSAGELVAHAYLAQGKKDQAGPILVAIAKDDDLPGSLRSRARQLAGVNGFDAIDDVDALVAEAQARQQQSAAPQMPNIPPEQ